MKYITLILWFLTCSFNLKEKVKWTKGYKVTLKDFKSEHLVGTGYDGVANIAVGFKYDVVEQSDSEAILDVYSYFIPEESFAMDFSAFGDSTNESMLNHEQRHFDLAEFYSRKFKASIQKPLSSENFISILDSVYIHYNSAFVFESEQYDKDTDHGTIDSLQKYWDKKIDDSLLYYEMLSKNTICIKLL